MVEKNSGNNRREDNDGKDDKVSVKRGGLGRRYYILGKE